MTERSPRLKLSSDKSVGHLKIILRSENMGVSLRRARTHTSVAALYMRSRARAFYARTSHIYVMSNSEIRERENEKKKKRKCERIEKRARKIVFWKHIRRSLVKSRTALSTRIIHFSSSLTGRHAMLLSSPSPPHFPLPLPPFPLLPTHSRFRILFARVRERRKSDATCASSQARPRRHFSSTFFT